MKKRLIFVVAFVSLFISLYSQINLLHEFHGFPGGNYPFANLATDGTYLYGMTSHGGINDQGTVFRLLANGSNFEVLHSFAGGTNEGRYPEGSLIISGSTLYGMTRYGGGNDFGTIFKIGNDGTNYNVLHVFNGGSTDGSDPHGDLTISGTTLFGLTRSGGDSDKGTIFKIATDGTGFTLLHELAGGTDDGAFPYGSLTISGTTLYGMTFSGGSGGTLFKIESNGTGFALLHKFLGGSADGLRPFGSLLLSGGTLFGMTTTGGSTAALIFSIGTDGLGFTVVHKFATGEGNFPRGSLILSGLTLYGMTGDGGSGGAGTVFKVGTDGSNFAILHSFVGGSADGNTPYYGSLVLLGSTLLGMTDIGGSSDCGVIFKIDTAGTEFSLIHEFAKADNDGSYPLGSLAISGSDMFGMTPEGGSYNKGTLFKIGLDGMDFTFLHEFAGGVDDGSFPYGSVIIAGSTLYGMTGNGGDNDFGTVFKIEADGSGYANIHEFTANDDDGGVPLYGSLILSGNTLFGMTANGGTSFDGTIFKVQTDGTNFSVLHSFDSSDPDNGSIPFGSLVISGSTLYGMTERGGGSNKGTIFKIETDGSGFALLHAFAGGAADGSNPRGGLIVSGATLYGMTRFGGNGNKGIIFKIDTTGTGYVLLHEFAGGGSSAYGDLFLAGTTLYGMTLRGGASNKGTTFKMQTDGSGFTLLHNFSGGGDDGSYPAGSLILAGANFYGLTWCGGDYDGGTIFSLPAANVVFTLTYAAGEHGSISGTSPQYVEYGGSGTPVTALADSGYIFVQWSDGSLANPRTDADVTADINVTAMFALETYYAVIFQTDGTPNATLTGNTSQSVLAGGDCTPVTANAPGGYHFVNWTGTGGFVTSADNPLTVTNVTQNMTITANFAADGPCKPGDFNGDGVSDLVWRHYLADGANALWLMNAAPATAGGTRNSNYPEQGYPGPFGAITILKKVNLPALADLKWRICGTGDFNGDYKEDILWRYNGTGGSNAVWLMDGTNKTSSVAIPAQTDVKWEIVGTGDFNNDQKVDILWRNKMNGKNMIWLMNGLTRMATVNLITHANLNWKIVGCGDFNGDGKTDILWRFQGTGGKNQVWIMNGTGRQAIVNIRAETDTKWQIAGVGDFNKDGKPDIIWRKYSTGGANRIWIMNNTAYVRTETLPAVADLNWKMEN